MNQKIDIFYANSLNNTSVFIVIKEVYLYYFAFLDVNDKKSWG